MNFSSVLEDEVFTSKNDEKTNFVTKNSGLRVKGMGQELKFIQN
jgi:hypothetical protein